jgi:pre-mRNA-splicing factor CWC26
MEKVVDMAYEMSKPLARYRDDEDLESLLKSREREGDPMLAYLKKKQQKKEGKKKEKPKWNGPYPQNRFDIRPGYRWDGVDRSNGFEKDLFSRDANKKAVAEMAYKWSVEDM